MNLFSRILLPLLTAALCACSAEHRRPLDPIEGGPQKPTPEPSRSSLLRKLSLHIRGELPDPEEYGALSEAKDKEEATRILFERARVYLKSEGHAGKMAFRAKELFQLGVEADFDHSSFNHLVSSAVLENRPWDDIYLSKKYLIQTIRESSFFAKTGPAIEPFERDTNLQWYSWDKDDPRISGAFTTPRFFGRYANTVTNQNRRRAAALYRILFCDDLRTVVGSPVEREGEILDMMFPQERSAAHGFMDPEAHDRDPACLKCHQKLDPMGRTFRGSESALAKFASPGKLVMVEGERKTERDARGLGDLVKMATEHSSYARCQVRHFWGWFVGVDVPLSFEREAELVQDFNRVGRRVNDFIEILVRSPEFNGQVENDPRVSGKAVLRSCDTCHTAPMPSFADWPIGGSNSSHRHWVKEIARVMAVETGGEGRTMPPRNAAWQPSAADIVAVRDWIRQGAPK